MPTPPVATPSALRATANHASLFRPPLRKKADPEDETHVQDLLGEAFSLWKYGLAVMAAHIEAVDHACLPIETCGHDLASTEQWKLAMHTHAQVSACWAWALKCRLGGDPKLSYILGQEHEATTSLPPDTSTRDAHRTRKRSTVDPDASRMGSS